MNTQFLTGRPASPGLWPASRSPPSRSPPSPSRPPCPDPGRPAPAPHRHPGPIRRRRHHRGQRGRPARLSGELVFSSYLGGQEWDEATGVATDRDGNTYVTGFTLSEDFPRVGAGTAATPRSSTPSSPRSPPTTTGSSGAPSSAAWTWTWPTRSPSTGRQRLRRRPHRLPDFPTRNGLQNRLRGNNCTGEPCHDAFVVKLSPTGTIQWSTLFGGTLNEEAVSVAVDDDSAVYVAGLTDSPNLPVRNAFQPGSSPALPGRPACPYDAFVTKLRREPDRLLHLPRRPGRRPRPRHRRRRGLRLHHRQHPVRRVPQGPRLPEHHARRGLRPPPASRAARRSSPSSTPAPPRVQHLPRREGTRRRLRRGRRPPAPPPRHRRHPVPRLPHPQRPAPHLDSTACTSEQPEEFCDDGFVTKFTATAKNSSTPPTCAAGPRTRASASTSPRTTAPWSPDAPTPATSTTPNAPTRLRRLHRRLRPAVTPQRHPRLGHLPRRHRRRPRHRHRRRPRRRRPPHRTDPLPRLPHPTPLPTQPQGPGLRRLRQHHQIVPAARAEGRR